MSDAFYKIVRAGGRHIFWLSSRPIVINPAAVDRTGPFIVVANHESPYDIPLLIRHCPRLIDFVSVTEVFRNPVLGRIYGGLNAFPHDRWRPDSPTVRTILARLAAGRVIGLFPEGRLRPPPDHLMATGKIRPGLGRLATLANVSVVPTAIVNSIAYSRPTSWLPMRRVRYGIAFGDPIPPTTPPADIDRLVVEQITELYKSLVEKLRSDG